MASRTLIRPTAFVDSPFGHDGKVARLAGGLNWFSAVELIQVEGHQRTSTELVAVEGIGRAADNHDGLVLKTHFIHGGYFGAGRGWVKQLPAFLAKWAGIPS